MHPASLASLGWPGCIIKGFWAPCYWKHFRGCFGKRKTRATNKKNKLKFYNCWKGVRSFKCSSKFNIPGKPFTLDASTWSSRWGQLKQITFLVYLGLLLPASWPLQEYHSSYTEMLKIYKLWHGFNISPFLQGILADLFHILPQHSLGMTVMKLWMSPDLYNPIASWVKLLESLSSSMF